MKLTSYLVSSGLLFAASSQAALVGLWQFDGDLSATIGSTLTTRSDSGNAIVESYDSATIDGDSATVANLSRLGFNLPGAAGEHWLQMPTSGHSTWTMVMDINFDQGFQSTFSALFQTDTGNSGDGDSFVEDGVGLGISGDYAGSTVLADTWYRVGIQYDGNEMRYYLDGSLANTVSASDPRFELGSDVLMFVDNGQETSEVLVNSLALYDNVLPAADLTTLGTASADGIPEPSASLLGLVGLAFTLRRRR